MATSDFQYFLNKRSTLLVISWTGDLMTKDVQALESCIAEVRQTNHKFIVFNLHGFSGYDTVLVGPIVNFQAMLRNRAIYMVLAGLDGPVKEQMLRKGLVIEAELTPTLKDALQLMLKFSPS